MDPVITGIISALVSGASTVAAGFASEAIKDAYRELKTLITQTLGKTGAVQSVEDDPTSTPAQALLVHALSVTDLRPDGQMATTAGHLETLLKEAHRDASGGPAEINIQAVRAKIDALVENLVASGSINIGIVDAETGNATISGLVAGSVPPARGSIPKN